MRFWCLLFFIALIGCDTVYTSPKVGIAGANTPVEIIPLNFETALMANQSPYHPRGIPRALTKVAGSGNITPKGRTPATTVTLPPMQKAIIALPNPPTSSPYIIGVSDVVQLRVPNDNVQNNIQSITPKRQGYNVHDDGTIALPDVGRIAIAGLSLPDAEEAIYQALVARDIEPAFSLDIIQFNSKKVSLAGSVRNPKVQALGLQPVYLEEALQSAGGIFASDDKQARVELYRDGERYQIPAKELFSQTYLKTIPLLDGDAVVVALTNDPDAERRAFDQKVRIASEQRLSRSAAVVERESEFRIRSERIKQERENAAKLLEIGAIERDYVYLLGEHKNQGRFALPFNGTASLADALLDGGGMSTREADLAQIYVLRAQVITNVMTAYHLDARAVTNFAAATRFQMRPNDIVFVTEQKVTQWNRVMQQIVPSLLTKGL